MPYFNVDNFSRGVDRSRPVFAAPQGAIWAGINGHITRGGDFEARKEFVQWAPLPAGLTFGLQETASGLFVFGSVAAPTLPSGVTYQRLEHPTSEAMTAILSTHLFGGLVYAIARFADASVHHFYNGTRIADWDGGAGNPTAKAEYAMTHKEKVYAPAASVAYHSALNAPAGWTDPTDVGAGFINISNHDSGNATITAIGRYQNDIAFFTELACHIWFVDKDDDNNAPVQIVSSGAIAKRSVLSYGDLDLFSLAQNGIRSIRARQSYDTASIADVGTPIDQHVMAWMAGLTEAQIAAAVSVVEPEDNRFLMAIGTRIYVFSYFPSNKIAAWTWYETSQVFTEMVVLRRRLYARAGDSIYLYGGASNADYYNGDECVIWLPFITLGKPGTFRDFSGMDIAAIGAWDCKWYVDPRLPDGSDATADPVEQVVHIGELEGVTYQDEDTMGLGHFTHVAPFMKKASNGYASISRVTLYYAGAEVEQG